MDGLHRSRHDRRTADPRPYNGGRRSPIDIGLRVPAGLVERLRAGSNGILDEQIHLLDVLAIDMVRRIETVRIIGFVGHQTSNMRGVAGGIEPVIAHNAAAARDQTRPEHIDADSQGADDAHSGDNDGICGIWLQHLFLLCICTAMGDSHPQPRPRA